MSEERTARTVESIVQLSLTAGVGLRTYRKLAEAFGSIGDVFSAPVKEVAQKAEISETVAEAVKNAAGCEDARNQLKLAEQIGASVVTIEDEDYPALLKQIANPPLVLYVRGNLLRDENAVAVVGARSPSLYGRRQAQKLSTELAAQRWTVVSGLARGIDSAAHIGALDAGGRTIAVLGSGLARVYPNENRRLADRIAGSGGAVISEFQITAKPERWNFPHRNRTISGLCRGVIVVEAAATSGSLITASWAADQGRTVFALPGRVDNPLSAGCHGLIRDGAVLVENAGDVLRELGSEPTQEKAKAPIPADLTDAEKLLLDLIGAEPKHIDALIAESSLPPAQVASSLVMLEIKKLIVQVPGKNFALA